jgi:hypothetical protein
MTSPSAPPEIFWVTGNDTSIGKTTLACALIRALNTRGTPAVGFKPYGALRYHDSEALLDESAERSACRLVGGDVMKLVDASPLTSFDWLDIVGPAYYLIYQSWPMAMFARTGSLALGSVEYFKSEEAAIAQQDPDVRARLQRAELPIDDAKIRELNFRTAGTLRPLNQAMAFGRLGTLGARAIVCEGAGRYIPHWQGCPGVNHIISIARGRLTIFPRANVVVAFPIDRGLVNTAELLAFLETLGRPRLRAELRFVLEPELRDAEADRAVAELLQISGLAAS